jgi:hypothetical protein
MVGATQTPLLVLIRCFEPVLGSTQAASRVSSVVNPGPVISTGWIKTKRVSRTRLDCLEDLLLGVELGEGVCTYCCSVKVQETG